VAKVYAFASADFPGAAESLVFDSDGTTAVGGFTVDPGSNTPLTGFTFTSGTYEILPVPSSTLSVATGINASGLIVGAYPLVPARGVGTRGVTAPRGRISSAA